MTCRSKRLFDKGWRFYCGDIYRKPVSNYMATYHGASAESGRGGAASAFDDSKWEIVDLPHDFAGAARPEINSGGTNGWSCGRKALGDSELILETKD